MAGSHPTDPTPPGGWMMGRAPQPSVHSLPRQDDPPPTVLEHLQRRFPHVDRETWTRRVRDGGVLGPGGPIDAATPYEPGLRVRYFREVAVEPVLPFGEEIVYADDRIVVADKPPFMPVIPAGPWVEGCLLYRLRKSTGCETLAPAHRLDLETTGLVLFSCRPDSRASYAGLFARGEVRKVYRALARVPRRPETRRPEPGVWHVRSRLVRGEPWFRMKEVAGPVNASTRITLVDWWESGDGGRGAFEVIPETGKKHQLRLHMARLGFPIVDDRLYPELQPEGARDVERPLRLLAAELGFRDPLTGEERAFRSSFHLPGERPAVPP